MTRTNLKNVVVVSDGSLKDEDTIGSITLCTLPDREVPGSKLLYAWANAGLDVSDLPDARQPVHIFQTACSSVKRRRVLGSSGERVQITADEIANNGTCDYQIGVKEWDVANKVIEYERSMRVTFDKQTSLITVSDFSADPRMGQIEDAIRSNFDANALTVPGQKVRNAVRATQLRLGGQNLRRKSGGVYFVPAMYAPAGVPKPQPTRPILNGLASVLEDLYGEDADFHTLTCANNETERDMVRKHFVINAKAKADELSAKAINRLREGSGKRSVRSDLIANMWNERRELLAAVDQFSKLVSVEQNDLAQTLTELDASLYELQTFADDEKKAKAKP